MCIKIKVASAQQDICQARVPEIDQGEQTLNDLSHYSFVWHCFTPITGCQPSLETLRNQRRYISCNL